MSKITVTPLRDAPRAGLIDEITAENVSVHIERMSESCYWLRIGEEVFWMHGISTVKQRPIHLDLTRNAKP